MTLANLSIFGNAKRILVRKARLIYFSGFVLNLVLLWLLPKAFAIILLLLAVLLSCVIKLHISALILIFAVELLNLHSDVAEHETSAFVRY